MKTNCSACNGWSRRGFTLVELLGVMGVLAVLMALLVPTMGAVRVSARRAEAKVQFSQWMAALELFRQEYGHYPAIGVQGKLSTAADTSKLVRVLTGREPDGGVVSDVTQLGGNTRRLAFYHFNSEEVGSDGLLRDVFGNTEIMFLCDANLDGRLTSVDGAVLAVASAETGAGFTPSGSELDLTGGVRISVVVYSAGGGRLGEGGKVDPASAVMSWR